ncbi:hypothetical protein A4X06_0g6086 [Tilletia controversa]|uniref:Uncharacterized protein n=1 Tax=Tilletia controversa TaxID=13291 RepID=A0A8X7MPN3_9BASI|nr:hypothetical protein CF328_g6179 [Tilletia controversa]KAE8243840.1 hypothetical protein A4X06_0g6086 [Tilletia controversa]CAD6980529.1 unnamed protein product [Tilletia controversa]
MPQYFTPIDPASSGAPSSSNPQRDITGSEEPTCAGAPATVLALIDSIGVALDAVRGAEISLKHASQVLHAARSAWASSQPASGRNSALSLDADSCGLQNSNTTRSTDVFTLLPPSSQSDGTFQQDHQTAESSMTTQPELPVSSAGSFCTSHSEPEGSLFDSSTLAKIDSRMPLPPPRPGQAHEVLEFAPQSSPSYSHAEEFECMRSASYASGVSSVWKAVFEEGEGSLPFGGAPSTSAHSSNTKPDHNTKYQQLDLTEPKWNLETAAHHAVPRSEESPTGIIQRFYSPRLVDARDSLIKVPSQESLGSPVMTADSTPKGRPNFLPRQSAPDVRSDTKNHLPTNEMPEPHRHNQERPDPQSSAAKGRWFPKTNSKDCLHSRLTESPAPLVHIPPAQGDHDSAKLRKGITNEAQQPFNDPSTTTPQHEAGLEHRTNATNPSGTSQAASTARTPHPWSLHASSTVSVKHPVRKQSQSSSPARRDSPDTPSTSHTQPSEPAKTPFQVRMNDYRQSTFFGPQAELSMGPATAAGELRPIDMCSPTLPLNDLLPPKNGEEIQKGRSAKVGAPSRSSSYRSKWAARQSSGHQSLTRASSLQQPRGDIFGYNQEQEQEGGLASDVLQLFMNGSVATNSVASESVGSRRRNDGKSSDSGDSDDSICDEIFSTLHRSVLASTKGSSVPTRANSIQQQQCRTPPGGSLRKLSLVPDGHLQRSGSMNSTLPSTPYRALRPDYSISVNSPSGSSGGGTPRGMEKKGGDGPKTVGLAVDTSPHDTSFGVSLGGSPLPRWEDRSEVNDWIRRKTKERGITPGSADFDSVHTSIHTWRSAAASSSPAPPGGGRWNDAPTTGRK